MEHQVDRDNFRRWTRPRGGAFVLAATMTAGHMRHEEGAPAHPGHYSGPHAEEVGLFPDRSDVVYHSHEPPKAARILGLPGTRRGGGERSDRAKAATTSPEMGTPASPERAAPGGPGRRPADGATAPETAPAE